MSYILEALKKSEKERGKNKEEPSTSRTVVYPGYTKSDRPSHRRLIYVSLLVIMSCALVYLLTTYLTVQPEKTGTDSAQRSTSIQRQSAADHTPDTRENTSIVISPQTLVQRESAPPENPETTSWVEDKPEGEEVYPDFNELPQQLKTSIPSFTVAGHTYSDQPDQRMLILNNTIVREGQAIANGLRLEKITWDGAILSFEEVLFRVNSAQ